MITCKEDLTDTYIKNDDGELRELYISKLKEFGIYACGGDGFDYLYRKAFIGVRDWGVGGQLEWNNTPFKKAKELTLSDLKPKPTKFVKVEESIFDLKGEFERGELFTKKAWGEYVLIKEDTHLASLYEMQSHENSKIGIYRQVEIDWRDEVAEFTGLGKDFYTWVDCIDDMYNFDFVEMCHLVSSLTEKPEGV